MGTRSTTKIYEDGKLVLAIYKQFDGYVKDGWGDELKKFIGSGLFVNGLPGKSAEEKTRYFNGITDFALQLVTKYKEGAGDIYATTADDEQEYNYKINYNHEKNTIRLECKEEPSYNTTYNIDSGGVANQTPHVNPPGYVAPKQAPIDIPMGKVPSSNPKGWHKEPVNHALASKGIKVGKSRVKR